MRSSVEQHKTQHTQIGRTMALQGSSSHPECIIKTKHKSMNMYDSSAYLLFIFTNVKIATTEDSPNGERRIFKLTKRNPRRKAVQHKEGSKGSEQIASIAR